MSYSDQLAVVRVSAERAVEREPGDQQRFIARRVTLAVERTHWHREGAPVAPKRLRIIDWGWCQTASGPAPMLIDGVARLRVGRRYLIPLVRYGGEWTTVDEGRLLLVRNRVRGGVDVGRPVVAHRLLLGLSVPSAARVVANTPPYRAAVRLAGADPIRRWRAVSRDRFRVQGVKDPAWVMDLGATPTSRWFLFQRTPGHGRLCLGVHARPRRQLDPAARDEACLNRARSRRLAIFGFRSCRGSYAFGTAPSWSSEVLLRVRSGPARLATIWPKPRGTGRGFVWVAPLASNRRMLTVLASGAAGDRRSVTTRALPWRMCKAWRPAHATRHVNPR